MSTVTSANIVAFLGALFALLGATGVTSSDIAGFVNVAGAIVAIADMNSLEAEVDVNESNVGQLQTNQPAEIQVQAIPDHTYKGVLRQVIPTADRTKATVTVKVSVPAAVGVPLRASEVVPLLGIIRPGMALAMLLTASVRVPVPPLAVMVWL